MIGKKAPALLIVLWIVLLLTSACGKPNKVGSEKLLDIEQEIAECRLGERCPTPSPLADEGQGEGNKGAITNPQPPQEPPPPPPPPQEQFFDVTLVEYSPYYEPGNALTMHRSLTLRVTNKDTCACRSWRTFTAEDGSFSSPRLAPGESWTIRLGAGAWTIVDQSAGFIRASLEVTA
ncbi:MAG: hypothetical protein KY429_01975 [Actinobacteria bacterium]|nr:hypothetical protein [Actinomycetota bacterium]